MLACLLLLLCSALLGAVRAVPIAQARTLYEEYAKIEWGLDRMDAAQGLDHLYSYDFTGHGVRVYVLDSGVDALQLDFEALNGGPSRVVSGTSFYPSTWTGLPGNTDSYDHGTNVASLVGGIQYGVAKGVTIVPVRILDSTGSGSIQGLIQAVQWSVADALSHGSTRNIINLSIDAAFSFALDTQLKAAQAAGFVTVGAAGNSQTNACSRSPGGSSYVISVGSMQHSPDQISSFSNFGPCVSIFAPGTDVAGALANNGENQDIVMSGTSMSSPAVSGVVALLWDKYPSWNATAIRKRVLEMALVGALDLSPCTAAANCSLTTNNLLVQTPPPEVLLINDIDVVFTPTEFGSTLAFWPHVQGATLLFATCQTLSKTSASLDKSGRFVVLDFRSCPGLPSAYPQAMLAQQAGALGVLIVAPDCMSVQRSTSQLPAAAASNLLTIPSVCVPSASTGATLLLDSSLHSSQASLGLVRQVFDSGPSPWTFTSIGSQALGKFTEWRTEWSGSAMAQSPNGFCVAFTPNVVAGSASLASIAIALSSKPAYRLSAQYSPDATVDAYVGRFGPSGTIVTFKNSQNVAAVTDARYTFDGTTSLYARVGFVKSGAWAVELGKINASSPYLRYEDPNAYLNINYFSFSSSGAATVEFANIGDCPNYLQQGLVQTQGLPGKKTSPPVTSNIIETTLQPTFRKVMSPTLAPQASWSANRCRQLTKATCSEVSNGACEWIQKKCYFVISEG